MATPKDLKNEVASIDRDITQVLFGGILKPDDDTLLTRGKGKGLKIYRELERDCHASAVLDKRKFAVTARPYIVDPASDRPIDVEAADFIRELLDNIRFDQLNKELLDANLMGFAVVELLWGVKDNRLVPVKWKARDQRRFVFDQDSNLRMLTPENRMTGIELPDRKFIVHTFGGKAGNPYGVGLGSKLFWPVFFKRQGVSFWLTFADKFGSPTAVGKYPSGTGEKEQAKLLNVLRSISNDAGVIVPEGMIVELLEAARSGSADVYERLCRYMDEQISEAVLGETLTTNIGGQGSRAAAETHNEVREELAQDDADQLSDTLNDTLIRWLTELNFPGAEPPTVWRDFQEPEDTNTRAERDKKLHDMGWDMTPEYVQETYGPGFVKRVVAPAQPTPFPAFSEPAGLAEKRLANRDNQDALVQAADALASEYQAYIGDRLQELRTLLDETRDLALFRERLNDLVDADPSPQFVEALQRAGFTAQLLGRSPR